jgi:hypothetical protein
MKQQSQGTTPTVKESKSEKKLHRAISRETKDSSTSTTTLPLINLFMQQQEQQSRPGSSTSATSVILGM